MQQEVCQDINNTIMSKIINIMINILQLLGLLTIIMAVVYFSMIKDSNEVSENVTNFFKGVYCLVGGFLNLIILTKIKTHHHESVNEQLNVKGNQKTVIRHFKQQGQLFSDN